VDGCHCGYITKLKKKTLIQALHKLIFVQESTILDIEEDGSELHEAPTQHGIQYHPMTGKNSQLHCEL
jgi:hypothetical protein